MQYVAVVTLHLNGTEYNSGDLIDPADLPSTKIRSMIDKGLIDAVIAPATQVTDMDVAGDLTVTGTINGAKVWQAGETVNAGGAIPAGSTGTYNTATGKGALYSNTTGSYNVASGGNALYSNTTGYYNTATGFEALRSNTTAHYNTAAGYHALRSNTTGGYSTAAGYGALRYNTTGAYNTAAGFTALYSNTTGAYNTATGFEALRGNTTGHYNTVAGYHAQQYGSSYTCVTAIGADTQVNGNYGTAIGYHTDVTGAGGVAIGTDSAGNAAAAGTNEIVLGTTSHTVVIPSKKVTLGASGPTITTGTGSPESVVTAPVGSLYTRSDGGAGTTLYVKESGTGNTGWVAK